MWPRKATIVWDRLNRGRNRPKKEAVLPGAASPAARSAARLPAKAVLPATSAHKLAGSTAAHTARVHDSSSGFRRGTTQQPLPATSASQGAAGGLKGHPQGTKLHEARHITLGLSLPGSATLCGLQGGNHDDRSNSSQMKDDSGSGVAGRGGVGAALGQHIARPGSAAGTHSLTAPQNTEQVRAMAAFQLRPYCILPIASDRLQCRLATRFGRQ